MNLVFAGTPQFAAVILRGVHAAGHTVLGVYTQPDRRAGRGRKPRASAVKTLAGTLGLPVLQPTSLRDADQAAALAALAPQIIVVAAYGLILPVQVLAIPPLGCVNVHASLLPRWRGAAPIQRAILAGDEHTGVSIMRMAEGLDTGPVLAVRREPIGCLDTAGSVHDRLAALGRDALLEVLARLAHGPVAEVAQDDTLATYAHRIDKREARIDWHADAVQVARQVRAFNPVPGAWTQHAGQRLKILLAQPQREAPHAAPGCVIEASGDRLCVACGHGRLRVLEVQPQGRRAVGAAQFLNARGVATGECLD
jgi:methionyl-tRNA formyltransferase